MKKLLAAVAVCGLLACNSGNNSTNEASDAGNRPRDVNEAVTNDTKIVNDSVIVRYQQYGCKPIIYRYFG